LVARAAPTVIERAVRDEPDRFKVPMIDQEPVPVTAVLRRVIERPVGTVIAPFVEMAVAVSSSPPSATLPRATDDAEKVFNETLFVSVTADCTAESPRVRELDENEFSVTVGEAPTTLTGDVSNQLLVISEDVAVTTATLDVFTVLAERRTMPRAGLLSAPATTGVLVNVEVVTCSDAPRIDDGRSSSREVVNVEFDAVICPRPSTRMPAVPENVVESATRRPSTTIGLENTMLEPLAKVSVRLRGTVN
jgi:hypothetical protein